MAADALPKRRLVWLDLARTAALAAMASYHFGYDLEAFGHLPPGTMTTGLGALYARAIASTRPFTASTDLSNIACSSLSILMSMTFSMPLAPITVGTPT